MKLRDSLPANMKRHVKMRGSRPDNIKAAGQMPDGFHFAKFAI